MKRILLVLISLIFNHYAFAQLESAHWYFGVYSGLDFSTGAPQVVYDGALETGEGCASISDVNGNLLFYTDGTTVYNRNHQQLNTTDLKGNPSSTQSAIIVPYPGNADLYYIFTVDADDLATPTSTSNEGFHYYLVDMTLNGGLGGMVNTPNNNLLSLTSEKVTAVAHKNNNDIWVITHFEDKFYSYLVSSTGLNTTPIISQVGPYIDPQVYPVNSRGYIKASPNGKKIGIAHLSNLPLSELGMNGTNDYFANTYDGHAALYDFDDQTGIISNEIILSTDSSPYGLEFSFDSKYAYFEYDYHSGVSWTHGEIAQYDLSATDIPASKIVIFDDFQYNNDLFQARGALQLALDNKIYYSPTLYSGTSYFGQYLSVIHSPHLPGLAANFEYNAIQMTSATNSSYVSFGLPPFITSFFNAVIIFEGGISGSEACLGEALNFSVIANSPVLNIAWNFGDGNISNLLEPSHVYSAPGTYTVSATVTTDEETVSISRQVTIHPLPSVNNNVELIKCDYDGDGIALFEIYDANDLISSDSNLTITYHESTEEAASGENSLPNIYTNTSNNQTLYVRVENQFGCLSYTQIKLSTTLNAVQVIPDFGLCDLNSDGVEIFDLDEKIPEIESLYSESITVLSYHNSISEAEFGTNPLTSPFSFSHQDIYVRVQTANCFEIVKFKLVLLPLPIIELADAKICPEDSWLADAGSGYISYQWNGLSGTDLTQPTNQQTVTITNVGTYSVILRNTEGCEFENFFTISHFDAPIIDEILITNNGFVTIKGLGQSPFEYSLNGVFWQSSNEFSNLQSGDYTVWVKDANGCISAEKTFGIIEIPNFISPNNDGKNDNWIIRGISNYPDVHIQIFDRYGKLFVDRINHNNSQVWDGKYLGRTVNSGSYWYIIKLTDGRKYVGSLAVRNY